MNLLMDLQRFADENPAEDTPPVDQEPETGSTEPEKPEGSAGKTYTDADLNRILEKRLAREKAKWEKAVEKSKAEATQSAEEKAQARQAALEKQVAELMADKQRHALEKAAAAAFKEAGITEYDSLLSMAVGADEEATLANVEVLTAALKAQRQAGAKSRASGSTPPSTSPSSQRTDPMQSIIDKWK